MVTKHRFRFGPVAIGLDVHDDGVAEVLGVATALYEPLPDSTPVDLQIIVQSSEIGLDRPLRHDHWDFEGGFGARFGHFFVQRWRLDGETPTVQCGITRSPLYPVRPFLDYEFHTARADFGKFMHEHILVPSVLYLFSQDTTVFHAAALTAPNGTGLMITGEGGVGKTSLALELGRRPEWKFLSDDLVIADSDGTMYLNAAWPKVYSYNVIGDRALEEMLLTGRSPIDRLHWWLLRRRPKRVRRSISPVDLYGSVATTAKIGVVLQIVRSDVDEIMVSACDGRILAKDSVRVMLHETQRFGRHAETHQAYRAAHGLEPLSTTWFPDVWTEGTERALDSASLHRVAVPRGLSAVDYRQAMLGVVDRLVEVGP